MGNGYCQCLREAPNEIHSLNTDVSAKPKQNPTGRCSSPVHSSAE